MAACVQSSVARGQRGGGAEARAQVERLGGGGCQTRRIATVEVALAQNQIQDQIQEVALTHNRKLADEARGPVDAELQVLRAAELIDGLH